MRLRVTRVADIHNFNAKDSDKFSADCQLEWGTEDPEYPQCRLINQTTPGQIENPAAKPNDPPPQLVRVYEQIDEENETMVGDPNITYDEDGNINVEINWLQFSSGTAVNETVGVTTAPAPYNSAILKSQDAPDDGTLRRIKRVYNGDRYLSDVQEIRFSGKLLVRTIVAIGFVPPTPSGYTLVGPGVLHPDGRQVYTYQFAKANGGTSGSGTYIGSETQYVQSPDQGTTGVTVITTNAIVTEGGANPVVSPGAGFQLIDFKYTDDSGYRLWTVIYANGAGLVESNIEYQNKGLLVIYTRTAINTPPSAPSPTIGGTVVLIETNVENGQRLHDGTLIYRYRWAEGKGVISNETRGESDGAIVQTITQLDANAITPTSPGGSYFLIALEQRASNGHYVNVAVYKKTPVTKTFKKRHNFPKPGLAYFLTSPDSLVLSPPVDLVLLADYEVSYDTSQISDVPFTVTASASLNESYTPTDTGVAQGNQRGLGNYLAGTSSVSGAGGTTYNGVLMDEYSAVLISSIPAAFPSGTVVIDTDNDPYLTAIDGTVVFRRTKVTYAF